MSATIFLAIIRPTARNGRRTWSIRRVDERGTSPLHAGDEIAWGYPTLAAALADRERFIAEDRAKGLDVRSAAELYRAEGGAL